MDSLLVTGATGTFGRAFLRAALADPRWRRVIAYSRDEVKQFALYEEFKDYPALRLFLGDVRDPLRLQLAMRDVDTVVHAAALKRVDAVAYSPSEVILTNVSGTMNVVNAAIQTGVGRVVVISSDKAVNATNIYGATKFCAETYAVQANAYGYASGTHIAAVRYGNILGSRGSVVHVWRDQLRRGQVPTLTHPKMTRFIMTIEQAVDLVNYALDAMQGGEVFIPELPSAYIADLLEAVLLEAVGPNAIVPVETGLRPGGEKMAEALLNEEEPARTRRIGCYMAVAPSHHEWTSAAWNGELVSPDYVYRSDKNPSWLKVGDLRRLIATTETCRG